MAERYHSELKNSKVYQVKEAWWSEFGARLLKQAKSTPYDFYIKQGQAFALGVIRVLRKQKITGSEYGFFGFACSSLETLRFLREEGIVTVLDQFDAGREHERIHKEELRRWPGWELPRSSTPEAYFDRIANEWDLASMIMVNSVWTRDALIKQGVDPGKIIVIPLTYDYVAGPIVKDFFGQRPLRVLCLGRVTLTKGIQYLMQAAAMLDDAVEIRIVGPIGITAKIVKDCPSNMTFLGAVRRSQIHAHYNWADVFVFPTLSDGFGLTQLEAMAHGLPIIATSRCGKVVTDGVDGFIVPPNDSEAIGHSLAQLAGDPMLCHKMAINCRRKIVNFQNLEDNGRLLLRAMEEYQI
ncbi:MAG: glycosyltransferase family 4 protein [Nitrospirae bacterium]|nr:glycosyltransferase family 4 protein [Nitrospirota bacterium]